LDQKLIITEIIAGLKERLAEVDRDLGELQAWRAEVAGDLAQFEQVLEEMLRMEKGEDEKGRRVFGEN
jgi:hypothetical protein